jgi:Concanavalin A-like lectin/glucanases superfamily
MTASLIALTPLVLLGLVTALCFVGCGLHTHGLSLLGPYQDGIIADPNIVACWPLNDPSDLPTDNPAGTRAADISANNFYGYYSGAAGTVKVQQPGIVPGDIPSGSSTANQCAFFNGGLVQVGFQQALNPAKFTLEAWVQPSWTKDDPAVQRAVLVSANSSGAGYGLIATPDNFWEIDIGVVGNTFFSLKATQPIELGTVHYLAVTFDGTTLTLFAGAFGGTLVSFPGTPMAGFVPEDSSTATPLFIGMGHPDTGGMFPFNGFIQDVAVYKDALSFPTLMNHFNAGSGG